MSSCVVQRGHFFLFSKAFSMFEKNYRKDGKMYYRRDFHELEFSNLIPKLIGLET